MGETRILEKLAEKAFYENGHHDLALIYYYKSLEASPDLNIRSRNGVVDCLLALQRWDAALNFLNQTLKLEPTNFSTLYRKINLLLALGKISECEKVLKVMEELSNATPNFYGQKIEFYARKSQVIFHLPGRKKEALKYNKKALELVPHLNIFQTEWKNFLLADTAPFYIELGKYRKAIEVCNQVLSSSFRTYWDTVTIHKAEACYYLQEYETGINVLKEFTINSSYFSSYYVILAVNYAGWKRNKEAMEYLNKSTFEIQNSGKQSYFTKRFYYVYAGRVYHHLENYKEALKLYTLAYEIEKEFRFLATWKSECEKKLLLEMKK